ncbi:type II/IV secretion system protein [Candidatus Parcubacteria bacterium]|nr:MAG: type II/IV secretion system protein [Candidatus Parcubacteria bacterium]
MTKEEQKIKGILLKAGYLTEAEMSRAQALATSKDLPLVEFLISEDLVSRELLGQAVAKAFGLKFLDLDAKSPSREQVVKIPESIGKKNRAVLFLEDSKKVLIASDQPDKPKLAGLLKSYFPKKKIELGYALPSAIDQAFFFYRKPLNTRFAEIIRTKEQIAPELLEIIIAEALTYRASDIHFDTQEKEALVRFRIDGVLQEAGRIPKSIYENILNRVKVQSHLRIDEHFITQDGAMRFMHNRRPIDLRISIAPTLDGEKIVMRILAEYVKNFTLTDLGVASKDLGKVFEAIQKPFGMIIVTGPTGAGKTTTLYGLLRMLNRSEVNIATIEDPVEYKVLGLNQIQVNEQTNLTFANGLRSIVRQDPDIIMVGEIRDEETAEISVNAALTGHLLLSTFHANDAATAIPRLIEMGVEPFLLASTLELLVAQRLVRKLCEHCRYRVKISKTELNKILPNAKYWFGRSQPKVFRAKGCNHCSNTGYRGRLGIFEFISMNRAMQDLINQKPTSQEIWRVARKFGSRSLFEDGLEKVKIGLTSLEELLRVATPPPELN